MMLPLNRKLKKRLHKAIALAQDIMIMEVYDMFPSAVIHGGTAIWRCYGSNRFSEDVDVYLPEGLEMTYFKKFVEALKDKDFSVAKFKKTENAIFSKFSFSDSIVRFEAIFKDVKDYVIRRYEMIDGNFMLVNTLMPEKIVEEKILTYVERRKARDLYDIFFLSNLVKRNEIKSELLKAIENFEKPLDEKELKTLIIYGSIPTADTLLNEVKAWASRSI